jgi:hypothetical protein
MFEYVTVYGKLTTEEELSLDSIVNIQMWHGMFKIDCPFRVKTILVKDGIKYISLEETEIIRGKIKN